MALIPIQPGSLGRTLIVTHRDLDGFVAAALATRFLHEANAARGTDVEFVDFSLRQAYGRAWDDSWQHGRGVEGHDLSFTAPPETVFITDFPLTWVPEHVSLVHVDHHKDVLEPNLIPPGDMPRLKSMLMRSPRSDLVKDLSSRNSGAPSAAALLLDRVTDLGWIPDTHMQDAISLATQVDTLSFPDASSAINARRPPMLYDFAVRHLSDTELRTACMAVAAGRNLMEALVHPHRDFLESEIKTAEIELGLARQLRRRLGAHGSALVLAYDQPDKSIKLCHYEDGDVLYAITGEIGPAHSSGSRSWHVRLNLALRPATWGGDSLAHLDTRPLLTSATGKGAGHAFSASTSHEAASYAAAVAWVDAAIERLHPAMEQALRIDPPRPAYFAPSEPSETPVLPQGIPSMPPLARTSLLRPSDATPRMISGPIELDPRSSPPPPSTYTSGPAATHR